MYTPHKPVTQKTRPLNRPSKHPPPGGGGACTWKIALKFKVKQSKNGNLLPTKVLALSILKRKFPSVDKPLRIYAPSKTSPSISLIHILITFVLYVISASPL